MKIDVERLGGGQVRLRIEIPAEKVDEELERNYRTLRTQVSVPGFRRGRVPTSIIKARFADHIKSEAIQNLVPPAYEHALTSEKLTPLSTPDISPSLNQIEIKEKEPIVFEATVDIKPDFVLPKYEDLVIDKAAPNIPREEVETYIGRLQDQNATYNPIDEERPVQEGDCVRIDSECLIDGRLIENGAQQDVDIEPGVSMLPPEVESELIGMVVGEAKQIEADISDAYPNSALAGKHTVFDVTLNAITEKQLPHLDDEFAKDLGYEDYNQLYGAIWNNLVEEEKAIIYGRQREEVLQQLIERTEIEIPASLVNQHVQETIQNIQQQLNREGRAPEEAGVDMEKLPEELREDVIRQTKQSWFFDEIAEREAIQVSDNELDQEIRLVAEQQNRDPQKYTSLLKANNQLEEFRGRLRNEKIYRFLVERASAKQSLIIS